MEQPLPPMAHSPKQAKTAVSYDISIGAWQGKWSTDISAVASVSSYVVARYFGSSNRIDLVECKNLASSTPANVGEIDNSTGADSAEAEFLSRAGTLNVHVAEVGGINLSACGLRSQQKLLSMHSFTVDPHPTHHENGNDRYLLKGSSQGGYYATYPAVIPAGSYLLCLLADDPSQYILLNITEANKLIMIGQGRLGHGKDFYSSLKLSDGELHEDPANVRANEYFQPTHFTVFGFPSAHYGLGYDAATGEYIIVSLINLVLAAAGQMRQQHPNAFLPPSISGALTASLQILSCSSSGEAPVSSGRNVVSPLDDSHNVRSAVVIQRGYLEAEWSDLMWKGSPNRYSTRQKFFCYNAVTGACAFECVRVDRRFVLLAEGEEVSFPIAGDRAQMSSDGESDATTSLSTYNNSSTVNNPLAKDDSEDGNGGAPTRDDSGSPLPNRASLHTRMEAHRRSIALVGTERQPARRRGCLLIPVNLNKQVGCLLYSHNYLSVPPTGRSTGVVPRIGYSMRRAGGAALENATAMLQKRIFAHDEPWTNCVFLTNANHNLSRPERAFRPANSMGEGPLSPNQESLSSAARSFLMSYSKHSGTVWISQIYQIASNKAKKGVDVALPHLAASTTFPRLGASTSLPRYPSGLLSGSQGARNSSATANGFHSPLPLPSMVPSPTHPSAASASQLGGSTSGGNNRRQSRGGSPLSGGSQPVVHSSPHRRASASSSGRPSSGRAALEQWRRSPTNTRSGKDVRLYDEESDELTSPYTVTSRYTNSTSNPHMESGSPGRTARTKGVGFADSDGGDGYVTTTRTGADLASSANTGVVSDDEAHTLEDQRQISEYNQRVGHPMSPEKNGQSESDLAASKSASGSPDKGNTINRDTPEAVEAQEREAQAIEPDVDPNRPAPIKVSLAALLAAVNSGPSTPIPIVTDFSPETPSIKRRKRSSQTEDDEPNRPKTVPSGGHARSRSKMESPKRVVEERASTAAKKNPRPPRQRVEETKASQSRISPPRIHQQRQTSPPEHTPTKPKGPHFHSGIREISHGPRSNSPPRGFQRSHPLVSSSDSNYDEHGRRRRSSPNSHSQEDYDNAAQQRQKMYSYKVPTLPKSGKMTVPAVVEDLEASQEAKARFHRRLKSTTPRFTGTSIAQERESSPTNEKPDESLNATIPAGYLHGASRPMFSSTAPSKASQRLASLPPTTDDFHADIANIIRYLQETEQIAPIHSKAIELALQKVPYMEEGDDDGGLMEKPEYKYAGVIIQTPWRSAGRVGDTHKSMALPPDRRSELAKFDKMFQKKREEEIPEMTFGEKQAMRLYKTLHTREEYQAQQIKKMMATLKIHRITKETYDNKDKKDPTAPDPPVSVKKVVERLAGTDINIRKANLENKIKQREKEHEKAMGMTKVIPEDAMKAHVGRMYDESRKIHQQNMDKLMRTRDQKEKKERVGSDHRPLTPRDEKALAERLIDKSVLRREQERAEILNKMDKQAGFNKPKTLLGPEALEAMAARLSTPNRPQ